MIRTVLTLSLVALVIACPVLCRGAFEPAHDLCRIGDGPANDACSPLAPDPERCPDEGGGCICEGALSVSDGRSAGLPLVALLPAFASDSPFLPHLAASPAPRTTGEGSPPGPSGRDILSTIQEFRC